MLLNGVLGKQFDCRRGVRQGDPLSPLLFDLVVDLQSMLNEALHQQLIQFPLQTVNATDFLVIQYVDDTILVLLAEERQVIQVKNLMMHFASHTGPKVNYSKSFLVPINVQPDLMSRLITTLGCH